MFMTFLLKIVDSTEIIPDVCEFSVENIRNGEMSIFLCYRITALSTWGLYKFLAKFFRKGEMSIFLCYCITALSTPGLYKFLAKLFGLDTIYYSQNRQNLTMRWQSQ